MSRTNYQLLFLFLLLAAVLTSSIPANAQHAATPWWTTSDVVPWSELPGERMIEPSAYAAVQVDLRLMEQALSTPDLHGPEGVLLSLPWPDGTIRSFQVKEAPVMAAALAARFPDIRTYRGVGVEDPAATLRLDWSPTMMHAMVLSPEGTMYIDPMTHAPGEVQNWYQSYFKANLAPWQEWTCESEVESLLDETLERSQTSVLSYSGTLRDYRLAVATTGEYAQFHGGTVTSVTNAIVVAINRVNGVYEQNIGVTMTLIPNNDQIIFFNASTDPYTNFSGGAMLSQNQATIDNIIGTANYDIGHVFSTGGGGIASLGSVCSSNFKARGVTGLPSPINDPFYIDYVAHEIGHQFAANHTFNGTSGSCSGGSRVGSNAYEPGSGTTIMAYAGICPGQNIQNNSDDHFHVASLGEMHSFTRNGGGNTCPVITTDPNQAPVATAKYDGLTLPISTPFQLIGSATDPDGDPLTYCWEEWDLGPAGPPNNPVGNAPIIRSRSPLTTGTRLVPIINRLVSNSFALGEILPSTSRELNFRLTVRDNVNAGAGVDIIEVNYEVTNQAGPFLVTSPNQPLTWGEGTFQTVTWDVANTDQALVNCQAVDILLSTDGGFTYPITLADSVPNDGSEIILVPGVSGTQNRIMVAAADHFFLDISNTNFTIDAASSAGFDALPIITETDICRGGTATYTFLTSAFGGFTGSLSVNPSGPIPGIFSFTTDPSPASAGDTLTVVVTADTIPLAATTYTFNLEITDGGSTLSFPVTLNYLPEAPPAPQAMRPVSGEAGVTRRPTFRWMAQAEADAYTLTIGQTPDLSTAVSYASLTDTVFTLPDFLAPDAVYYWEISGENACGLGETVGLQVFRTGACDTVSNQDGPVEIPQFGAPAQAISTLSVPNSVLVGDVNVWNIEGEHPAMNEISVLLRKAGVASSEVALYNATCANTDDGFFFSFDDESDLAITCPPFSDQAFQPAGSLSSFDGQVSGIDWQLVVRDNVFGNGGLLNRWTLELCGVTPAAPQVLTNLPISVPNAGARLISDAYLSAESGGSTAAEVVYTVYALTQNGNLLLDGVVLNPGDTFTQEQIDQGSLSYEHDGSGSLVDQFEFAVEGLGSSWTGAQIFNINVWSVGIDEAHIPRWTVKPNPAQNWLTIVLPEGLQEASNLYLYQAQGKLVRSQALQAGGQSQEHTFSVADLPTGVYTLQLRSSQRQWTERVLITR